MALDLNPDAQIDQAATRQLIIELNHANIW